MTTAEIRTFSDANIAVPFEIMDDNSEFFSQKTFFHVPSTRFRGFFVAMYTFNRSRPLSSYNGVTLFKNVFEVEKKNMVSPIVRSWTSVRGGFLALFFRPLRVQSKLSDRSFYHIIPSDIRSPSLHAILSLMTPP